MYVKLELDALLSSDPGLIIEATACLHLAYFHRLEYNFDKLIKYEFFY